MERSIIGLLILVISSTYAQKWSWVPGKAQLNGQVSVQCKAEDTATTIEIFHKSIKVVTGGSFTITPSVPGGIAQLDLVIKPVTESVASDYVCKGSNGKENSVAVTISVSFPNDGKSYSKPIGSKETTVEFRVVSVPRPQSLAYYRRLAGGATGAKLAEISPSGVVTKTDARFSIDATSGNLIILNIQAGDGGGYKAIVTSRGVFSEGTLTLVVGEKPKITTAPAKEYNLTNGEAKDIICTFEKRPTTVKWIQTSKSGTRKEILSSTPGAIILQGTNLKIITSLLTNEGDKFECFGENVFGNASASTLIKVVYDEPKIAALEATVLVVVSKDKTLSCQASGNPKPIVSWSKKQADGKYAALAGQTKTSGASEYKIVGAKGTDAGEYKCDAALPGMPSLSDSKSLTVALLTPPMIVAAHTTTSQQYAVGKNEKKELKCGATGSPLPSIKFMKDNIELIGATKVSNDAKQIVMKIVYAANSSADGGKVVCHAVSKIGNATADIKIEVITAPPPPTGLKVVSVENIYVNLAWNPVFGATNYRIYKNGVAYFTSRKAEAKVTALRAGTSYTLKVSAENVAGYGKLSAAVSVTTLKYGVPSMPRKPVSGFPKKFANVDAKFNWLSPSQDGGDKKIVYTIEYCPADKYGKFPQCETATTSNTSFAIKNLKANTKYLFKISAKNTRTSAKDNEIFYATTGASKAAPAKPTSTTPPKQGKKTGLGGGAIAGIIIAVILILLIVIDLFCCFFNECGFTHCCYQAFCAGKGKGKYAAADADAEKAELKETGNNHDADEVKTAPAEKEEKEPAKEKKSEDV